ncbi:CBN-SCAV-4 protein, partial [Aphelenchoides avenae]
MRDTLFLGYTDPLIDLLNSPMVTYLQTKVINGSLLGFPVPDIKVLGYFADYNGTNDEDYVADTGKKEPMHIGKIREWANATSLEWWGNNYTNDISGSVDGVYNGAFLEKNDPLKLFQSFICRHLRLDFDSTTTVSGISAYRYKFNKDNFNPGAGENSGYAFDNIEGIDYFGDWPKVHCPNNTQIPGDCSKVDCSLTENACNPCCKVAFPPGLVQQKCFPGRRQLLPFTAILSLPHFYSAPPMVTDSVIGIEPHPEIHDMGYFDIQPELGSTLHANFRTQLNIPVYRNPNITSLNHAHSTVVPCFWQVTNVTLHDYAYDYIRLPVMTLPK